MKFLAPLLVASGCYSSHSVAESTLPETRKSYDVVSKDANGSCWSGWAYLFFIIPIHFGDKDPAEHARMDALSEHPGSSCLVNTSLDSVSLMIPIPLIPVSLNITEVSGDVAKTKQYDEKLEKPKTPEKPVNPKKTEKK